MNLVSPWKAGRPCGRVRWATLHTASGAKEMKVINLAQLSAEIGPGLTEDRKLQVYAGCTTKYTFLSYFALKCRRSENIVGADRKSVV